MINSELAKIKFVLELANENNIKGDLKVIMLSKYKTVHKYINGQN